MKYFIKYLNTLTRVFVPTLVVIHLYLLLSVVAQVRHAVDIINRVVERKNRKLMVANRKIREYRQM